MCPVLCSNYSKECKWSGEYSKLSAHLNDECDYSMKECKFCMERFTHSQMIDHQVKCPRAFLTCEECEEKYENWLHDVHVSYCKKLPNCRFKKYGCNFKGSEEELIMHYNKNAKEHSDRQELFLCKKFPNRIPI